MTVKPINATEYIGRRLLVKYDKRGFGATDVIEIKILEVSPSGNWVRVMNEHGRKHWKPVIEVAVIEELKPLEPCPANP